MSSKPTATTITNVDSWLPLDGLEPGFNRNRLPLSTALDGRVVQIDLDGGATATLRVEGDKRAVWSAEGELGAIAGPQQADVVEAAPGLYFVDLVPDDADVPHTVTVALDEANGRATVVLTTLGESHTLGKPSVRQSFHVGTIHGVEPRGEAPAPTSELVGRRVLYVYSEEHAYEHVYLNDFFYTWQCLAGPERGQGDTDPVTMYKLRDEVFLLCWREKIIPCASVLVIDLNERRNTGKLVGRAQDGVSRVNFSFGALAQPLNETVYPEGLHPSRD